MRRSIRQCSATLETAEIRLNAKTPRRQGRTAKKRRRIQAQMTRLMPSFRTATLKLMSRPRVRPVSFR
jgi:hypothetical protein